MIEFSGCKVNLGLNVVERRADGFHDIETLFVHVAGMQDVVEVQLMDCAGGDGVVFSNSGIVVDCGVESNLCVRAWRLLQSRYGVGGARIHLHKTLPMGAGLGAGSANAVAVLRLGGVLCGLGLSDDELEVLAAELGSDTAFFVRGGMSFGSGRGEVLEPACLSGLPNVCSVLSGMYVAVVKPEVYISTAEAFAGVNAAPWEVPLREVLGMPVTQWAELLRNDFEASVFSQHPSLVQVKAMLYERGAIYASMSGSGSAIFGLFDCPPSIEFDGFCMTAKLH